jgi:hypothetical protein
VLTDRKRANSQRLAQKKKPPRNATASMKKLMCWAHKKKNVAKPCFGSARATEQFRPFKSCSEVFGVVMGWGVSECRHWAGPWETVVRAYMIFFSLVASADDVGEAHKYEMQSCNCKCVSVHQNIKKSG